MWLNTLAHGSRADLEGLAVAKVGSSEAGAVSYLAGGMLGVVDHHDVALGWLQRQFLVPLELRCATEAAWALWSTRDITTRVLVALAQANAACVPENSASTVYSEQ